MRRVAQNPDDQWFLDLTNKEREELGIVDVTDQFFPPEVIEKFKKNEAEMEQKGSNEV